jgi:glyoxylase-like metal-dependent hydrolase (beta-lactamase superfamily II)
VNIGAIRMDPVLDGRILSHLHGSKPLPDAGSPAWADQGGMVHDDGRVESTVGAFLVRTGDRVVLVDAGSGQAFAGGYRPPPMDVDDPADPFTVMMRENGVGHDDARRIAADFGRIEVEQGALPASLAELGVAPEDVTDVVATHLHYDHIGWVSDGGRPFFPNATVRCAAADLEHFLAGPAEELFTSFLFRALPATERLAPVLDRIETWAADGPIAPGIDVRLAPGHTPGSSVVVLSDGGQRALLLGDLVHCPLELQDDDFNLLVDHDQEMANRVREAYARELEGTDVPAAAAHFPGLRFGRLLPGETTRRWTFDGA